MDNRDEVEPSNDEEVQDIEAAKRRFAEQRDAIRRVAHNVAGRLEVEADVADQVDKVDKAEAKPLR